MEHNYRRSFTISKKRLSRQSSKRSSVLVASMDIINQDKRSVDIIKILVFHGMMKIFENNKKRLSIFKDQENQKKLPTFMRSANSSVMSIEPIKKDIMHLNSISSLFQLLENKIQHYIQTQVHKKQNKGENKVLRNVQNIRPIFLEEQILGYKNSNLITKSECNQIIQKMTKTKQKEAVPNFYNRKNKQIKINEHYRAFSETLKPKETSKIKERHLEQIAINRKKKIYNFQQNRSRDKQHYLKKISNGFNFSQYGTNSLHSIFEIFLQSLQKSNYILCLFFTSKNIYEPLKRQICQNSQGIPLDSVLQEQPVKKLNNIREFSATISKDFKMKRKIHSYTSQLQLKFKQFLQLLENITGKQYLPDKDVSLLETSTKVYLGLSNCIVKQTRALLNCADFEKIVSLNKQEIRNIVNLIYDMRFTLKYLEKQIENMNLCKKSKTRSSKWQIAFCAKFLPRKLVY